MENSTLVFKKDIQRLNKLSKARSDREDFLGALCMSYSAFFQDEKNLDAIMDIADAYADLGLYEFSNDYWYYYLSLCPKDKEKIAYAELSVNYFYMDDVIIAGYYFQKKIACGGFFDEEGVDGEIIRALEDAVSPRRMFKISWPKGLADYSYELKKAKGLLAKGEFFAAEEELIKIPEDAKVYKEALSALSAVYIITERTEEGIQNAKRQIELFGESMDAYCDLSAIYRYDGNIEKSKYYYKRALEFQPESVDVSYKAASCALDNEDEKNAVRFMDYLLKERPYETRIRFFAAIAEMNLKNYGKAKEHLAYLRKLSPDNFLYSYYYGMAEEGENGKLKCVKRIKYRENVTLTDEKRMSGVIKSIATLPDSEIKKAVKKKGFFDIVKWAIEYSDSNVRKFAAFIATVCWNKKIEGYFSRLMLQTERTGELKCDLLYILFAFSPVSVFNIVDSDTYFKIKHRRFQWEKDNVVFSLGYALAVSRLFYAGDNEIEKLANYINELYLRLKNPNEIFMTKEEVAAVAVCGTSLKKFGKKEVIAKLFKVKKKRLEELIKSCEKE